MGDMAARAPCILVADFDTLFAYFVTLGVYFVISGAYACTFGRGHGASSYPVMLYMM